MINIDNAELWKTIRIKPDKLGAVSIITNKILRNRSRYEKIEADTGVPWWWVAAVHSLEAGLNFSCHLHNGDPLACRTKHIPKGRPLAEPKNGSSYSWEESCVDALTSHNLCGLDDWSISSALERFEIYNGLGYRHKGRPSPYLWSFSNQYQRGKYTVDGVYDSTVVSSQCGAAVIVRHLVNIGAVDFGEEHHVPSNAPVMTVTQAIKTSPTAGAAGVSASVSIGTLIYNWFADASHVVTDAGASIIATKTATGPFNDLFAAAHVNMTTLTLAIIAGCSAFAMIRHIIKKRGGQVS